MGDKTTFLTIDGVPPHDRDADEEAWEDREEHRRHLSRMRALDSIGECEPPECPAEEHNGGD